MELVVIKLVSNDTILNIMKLTIALILAGFLTAPAWAADATAEVKAAAQKLSEQANYSWTAKSESPRRERQGGDGGGNREGRGEGRQGGRGGGRGGFGGFTPPSGKTEKDGFTVLTYSRGTNTPTEVVVKAGKVALKNGDEWSTAEEMAEDTGGEGGGFARGLARRAEQAKLPAAEAVELLGRAKDVKKDGDAYAGELTQEGLKDMFTFRGRGRGQGGQGGNADGERRGPDVSGLKGTAKFWVKDGVLAKYENIVTGKMPGFQGREMDVTRTNTVEIKDIGSAKVTVPAEAKKKLKS
jgi:hypothetical protein